mgnify:CR=1 FL=1
MANTTKNLVLTIAEEANDILPQTAHKDSEGLEALLEQLLAQHGAVSTGNQYGAGSTEYFFSVAADQIENLQSALKHDIDPCVSKNIEVQEIEF